MFNTLRLVGLAGLLTVVVVWSDDKSQRLEAGTDAVVNLLAAKVTAAAVTPGGLTADKVGTAVSQTLQEASGKLKELKKLDPTGDRVAGLVADKVAARAEGVLRLTGMTAGDITANVNGLKTAVRQNVKTYQATH